MLLAIDIGNTNIVLGVFKDDTLQFKRNISTDIRKTEDEYYVILKNFVKTEDIHKCIISSVVPNLNNSFTRLLNKYFNIEPIFVTCDLKLNIKFKYPNPQEIGADRIVNAVAGVEIYKPPLIIIDFGTATTFCFVDKEKNYYGGLILPGIPLQLKSLHTSTAKLPLVEIKNPEELIGKSTIKAIQSGIYYQTVGSINYIIHLLKKEYDENSKVLITGGLGALFVDKINNSDVILDKNLTLKGLNIIYNLNK